MTDAELLEKFVASFDKLDDMCVYPDEPVAPELDGGRDDSQWATQMWKPAFIATASTALTKLYQKLPSHLPPLYEQLVLSYRWMGVELDDIVHLLPNLPGPSLSPLLGEITRDPAFVAVLFPLGFIPFGKASGGRYDPVCFDTHRRRSHGDCPIVRIEHESILCDGRLGDWREVADSFRALVRMVISKADKLEEVE